MTNQEGRFAPVSTTIFRLVLKPECGLDGIIRLFDNAGQRGGKGADEEWHPPRPNGQDLQSASWPWAASLTPA